MEAKKTVCPVILTGYNERAVVALCRFFSSIEREFFLVARDSKDVIYITEWGSNVIIERATAELNIDLFFNIAKLLHNRGFKPCLCPTSEFLNRFVFENQGQLIHQGWHWIFPEYQIYKDLSDKYSSPYHIERVLGLNPPAAQKQGVWQAPCVLKPKSNLQNGTVLYPKICMNEAELLLALEDIDTDHWFSQVLIDGQSFYLCGYLDKRGGWNYFWQENMLQQPNGKSIVLARCCENPGVDVSRLMRGLHQMDYHGPFMMEVIRDKYNVLHFIEINPRFWGPLDLARRACPEILQRFLSDMDDEPFAAESKSQNAQHMYAWAYGAKNHLLKFYPSAAGLSELEIQSLLIMHDVYAYPDTASLDCQH